MVITSFVWENVIKKILRFHFWRQEEDLHYHAFRPEERTSVLHCYDKNSSWRLDFLFNETRVSIIVENAPTTIICDDKIVKDDIFYFILTIFQHFFTTFLV